MSDKEFHTVISGAAVRFYLIFSSPRFGEIQSLLEDEFRREKVGDVWKLAMSVIEECV